MTRIMKSIFYGSVITMTERRFSIPLILLSIASIVIGFFGFAVESIVLAIAVIVISLKLREKYLIKIQLIISIITIIVSGAFLAFLIYTGIHGSYNSYWLMRLIFGEPK